MDLLSTGGGGSFKKGDAVEENEASGLLLMQGTLYVLDIVPDGKMYLSRQPDGPPLTDGHQCPRLFVQEKFRKIIRAA